MKMNKLMNKLLDEWQVLDRIDEIRLEPELSILLSGGIVEIEGCYFLKSLLPLGFDLEKAVKASFDRTEVECEINHIHINDFVDSRKGNKNSLLEQGTLYTLTLMELFPDPSNIKIIFACTEDPQLDFTVRFHKQRSGENWLADDLDGYNEALMVIG